jgi:hypothetical protein
MSATWRALRNVPPRLPHAAPTPSSVFWTSLIAPFIVDVARLTLPPSLLLEVMEKKREFVRLSTLFTRMYELKMDAYSDGSEGSAPDTARRLASRSTTTIVGTFGRDIVDCLSLLLDD